MSSEDEFHALLQAAPFTRLFFTPLAEQTPEMAAEAWGPIREVIDKHGGVAFDIALMYLPVTLGLFREDLDPTMQSIYAKQIVGIGYEITEFEMLRDVMGEKVWEALCNEGLADPEDEAGASLAIEILLKIGYSLRSVQDSTWSDFMAGIDPDEESD